jgi:hypothetical protein
MYVSNLITIHYIKPQNSHHCFKRKVSYSQSPPLKKWRTMFISSQSERATAAPQWAALSYTPIGNLGHRTSLKN